MDHSHLHAVTQSRLVALSPTTLVPLVTLVTRLPNIERIKWSYAQLGGGMGGGVGGTAIFRFAGEARTRASSEPIHWSMILKVLFERQAEHPANSHYWRREAEVYQSGLLDDLPPQVAAPRCLGVMDFPREACWLWLEEIQDEYPGQWSLEQHVVVARHLGQFSGLCLAQRPLPAFYWLSRD